jgi:hypothetical protein
VLTDVVVTEDRPGSGAAHISVVLIGHQATSASRQRSGTPLSNLCIALTPVWGGLGINVDAVRGQKAVEHALHPGLAVRATVP